MVGKNISVRSIGFETMFRTTIILRESGAI